jgi:crotonobetainyl-CoA:carnitine CoA-transferase CaiB-like acyl-CoA transferase
LQESRHDMTNRSKRGPLDSVRVLELTSVVFGPYATQMLGELGADVIKIEPPEGDVLRRVTPARSAAMGVVFLSTNRNKRSVVLDLKTAAGQSALHKLVATADVFVHAVRPKAARKLKITYDDLRSAKKDLIHCTAVGFGSDGPYADKPAYDDVIQALSGTADLPRRVDGAAPRLFPSAIADKTGSHFVVQAVLAALYHRALTGEGQALEVPMFEAMTSFIMLEHVFGEVHQPPSGPMGYTRQLSPNRRPHPTADGYIVVMPFSTKQWQAFFRAIGRDDMVDNPRVTDPDRRSREVGALYEIVSEAMTRETTANWVKKLDEADVPAVPVNSMEDLLVDPHLVATDFFVEYDHPSEGRLKTIRTPIRMSATPPETVHRPPPQLGANTREVLREAGLSDAEIDALGDTAAG